MRTGIVRRRAGKGEVMILQILQPLWRYILIGLIIYLAYRAFKNLLRGRLGDSARAPGEDSPPPEVEEMVQDPVCGVYISKESAVTERRGDTQYHFCSEECRSKFKENP